jgi:tetratricopeptide (TPR) repeat protein
MEVEHQLNLFEPSYLLKESALRKLKAFDLDGAQEDLTRLEITEPKNPFATSSLVAITDLRKRLYRALKSEDPIREALALHHIWSAFQSEAGRRFNLDSTALSCLKTGVRQQIIQMLETAPEEEVTAAYPTISLGHLKLEARDYQGAAQALERLLPLHGGDPAILIAMANACYHLGRFREADGYYLRAFFEDTEAAFGRGVENKVLTLSLESFLNEKTALCWYPVYTVLHGALRLSPLLLDSAPWAHKLSALSEEEARSLDERDRARLFYIHMVKAEEASRSDEHASPNWARK